MQFGVFVSPAALLGGIVLGVIAMIVPFSLIEALLAPLPEPLRTIGVVSLSYVGMPALLSYLHYKKMFGTGFGSGIFTLYTWFYLFFGIMISAGGYYGEGSPNYSGMAAGVVMCTIGIAMIWWRRKTAKTFNQAVERGTEIQADNAREEAIQIQAEAILRAEQMRNEDNS